MTRSVHPSAGESSARDIPVRRLEPFPADHIGPCFAGGDPVMSHAVAVLSAMFPNGEDFFVRSVQTYRDRISDPKAQELFDDEVRYLLLWHALEESEHKAVAFDVYQEAVWHELLRRVVIKAMSSTTRPTCRSGPAGRHVRADLGFRARRP